LENKLADTHLFSEFDKFPKKKQTADFTTACHRDNMQFNRFKDVLPYEDNRLRLTPTKNNKYGYINASHITATVGSKQRFYIAAQGPNRVTLPYFWQSVWEAEVYLIVQLTDSTEDLHYMPDAGERCIDIGQEYQVWWEFSQNSGNCVTSKVRLCHVTSRRYRTLWHMHYTDWGDQGCPHSVSHFLGFLEEMQSVHQHSMGEIPPGHNKNPPILVHCTAGVGRTGLTILSDLLLYTVDHNQEVCIPRVVELLRHQRAYMIQTIAQYRFVYSLLIHYLKQTRLI
jgi:tyrosine-protein phosphatase non-receptor type 14/21